MARRTEAQKKGDALEKAVQLIETYILGTNPATKEAIVTIEPKKIITINDVHHEIDIYITIDYGKGYKAIFIFECKNWAKKVNKNEIIVFSKKVDITQAQTGYFIAKSFTRDAQSQAEQEGRVTLLPATEELNTLSPLLANFHIIRNMIIDSHANFTLHPDEILKQGTLSNESFVHYNNEDLLLNVFNDRIRQKLVDDFMRFVPADTIGEEVRFYERTQTLLFQPHELTIEGQECYRLDMRVKWETRIVRPMITSKVDIKTRGRVITYDSGKILPHGNIQVSFVELT